MKIQKRSHKKKYILIIAAVIIVAGLAGASAFWIRHNSNKQQAAQSATDDTRPMNDVDYNPPTEVEKQEANNQKEEIIKSQEKEQEQKDAPANKNIEVTLVRAGQAAPGQAVNIRTIIDGTSSGSCEITLTRNAQPTITKTYTVVYQATTATCQNSDIPVSSFSESGEWDIKIVVTANGKVSPAANGKVTVEK